MTRILIDMQACQTESRLRGIGRYAFELVHTMAQNPGGHELHLLMNARFPEEARHLEKKFSDLLPLYRIHRFDALDHNHDREPSNRWRKAASALVRESFIDRLEPDLVFCPSFFEGHIDNAVLSIGRLSTIPVAVTLHDLIPLIYRHDYLDRNPDYQEHYLAKVDELRRSAGLITISEASERDGKDYLNLGTKPIVNASEAADPMFRPVSIAEDDRQKLAAKFGIETPFIFYTGGSDHRKNLSRLISAFAQLEGLTGKRLQLVLAGSMPFSTQEYFRGEMQAQSIANDRVLFPGYVSDEDLVKLYNAAELFIFPSLYEGFGLPCLEAMQCGTPVLAANASSLPEVVGTSIALFDPLSVPAMVSAMAHVLVDDGFRQKLRTHGLTQAAKFSWRNTAQTTLSALEDFSAGARATEISGTHEDRLVKAIGAIPASVGKPSRDDLISLSRIIADMARITGAP
jgi:glycosyltransferase involved in cell wall biosynthesis